MQKNCLFVGFVFVLLFFFLRMLFLSKLGRQKNGSTPRASLSPSVWALAIQIPYQEGAGPPSCLVFGAGVRQRLGG